MIPAPVAWLLLTASSDTARLKWTPAAGASSYSVRVKDLSRPESRRWNSLCPDEPAYTCRTGPFTEGELPVAPGHRYHAVVRAISEDGASGPPAEGTFVAADIPPGPPLLRRPRIEDMRDRALSEAAAVRGLDSALERLANSYAGILSPLRLRSHRRWLNAVARYRIDQLSLLEEEGRRVKEEEAVLQAQDMLSAARGARLREQLLAEGMEAWVAYNKVLAPVQEQGRAIAFWILMEEKAWTEAVNRAEKSALAWLGAILLAALAAVGRLVLREARRTDRRILETANDLARRYVAALAWRPDLPPASGNVVAGNYRIARELLPDSFATAYEAQDLTCDRPVVLRRLSAPPAVGREADEMLGSARRAARFSHPRLEPIQLVFLERGALYWVCPVSKGRRLSELLGPAGPRPLGEVKSLFSQLADAIDAGRERGLVHGCLGPTAVLVDEDGSARIAGMGLAPFARRTWSAEELAYRAPEAAEAAPRWESDVFSLGVLFYRLCTGRLPYLGPDVLLQQRQQAYPPPTRLAALPKEADYVARGALQPDPGHRFASATAMFEIIVNFPG